jgi:hypothetical protein
MAAGLAPLLAGAGRAAGVGGLHEEGTVARL